MTRPSEISLDRRSSGFSGLAWRPGSRDLSLIDRHLCAGQQPEEQILTNQVTYILSGRLIFQTLQKNPKGQVALFHRQCSYRHCVAILYRLAIRIAVVITLINILLGTVATAGHANCPLLWYDKVSRRFQFI